MRVPISPSLLCSEKSLDFGIVHGSFDFDDGSNKTGVEKFFCEMSFNSKATDARSKHTRRRKKTMTETDRRVHKISGMERNHIDMRVIDMGGGAFFGLSCEKCE